MKQLHKWAAVPAALLVVAGGVVAATGAAGAARVASISPLQLAVQQIALRSRDVNSKRYTIKLIPFGNTVTNQITFDNCGYRFTSERYRVARQQVVLLTTVGRSTGISSEVVAYDTAAHALLAYNQWRASVTHCKLNVDIQPPELGAPLVRYNLEKMAPDRRLPIRTNEVTNIVVTIKATGKKLYMMAVIQLRGKFVDITWYNTPAPQSAAQVTSVISLAAITGRRLARH
jgi:hypothetical protein